MGSIDGFETVRVVSPGGTLAAEFVPAANMLCHSLTHRGRELLDAGRGVAAYAQRGKTMGIPLLHPWANRLAGPGYEVGGKRVTLPEPDGHYGTDPNGLPIHGVLPQLLRWELQPGANGADRISARLDYRGPELEALFPFVHELTLDVRALDDRLELVTTLRATGDDAVPVSFGYHPYLVASERPREEWVVSLGATERLVVDDLMIPTGERRPLEPRAFRLADQSWDAGLAGLASPPEFVAAADPQALTLTFDEGYHFAQVYAPPGHEFICFEPMTAPTNALISGDGLTVVPPGAEHRAAFSVAVTDN